MRESDPSPEGSATWWNGSVRTGNTTIRVDDPSPGTELLFEGSHAKLIGSTLLPKLKKPATAELPDNPMPVMS